MGGERVGVAVADADIRDDHLIKPIEWLAMHGERNHPDLAIIAFGRTAPLRRGAVVEYFAFGDEHHYRSFSRRSHSSHSAQWKPPTG